MTSAKTLFATARAAGVEILNERFDDIDGSPGLDPSGFTTLLATVGAEAGFPSEWDRLSASRRYIGPADTLNYVGLDSVSVVTAVPEPFVLADAGTGFQPAAPARPRRTPDTQSIRRAS